MELVRRVDELVPGYLASYEALSKIAHPNGYKRLEQEKFVWPVKLSDVVVTLSGEQLNWLLDGYDVWRMTPHKSLAVAHIG